MPTPLSPKKTARKPNANQDESAAQDPPPPRSTVRKATPRVRKSSPPSEGTLPLPLVEEAENALPPQRVTLEPALPVHRQSHLAEAPSTVPSPQTPPLPEHLSRRLAWIGIGILGLTALGSALFSDFTIGRQLDPKMRSQIVELAKSASASTHLVSPTEAMAAEEQIFLAYRNITDGGGADAHRAEILLSLAELALLRADAPRALAAAHAARAYAEVAKQPRLVAQATLCQAEGYFLAGHTDDLAIPASRDATHLLANLPADPPAPDLKFRLALLNARLHSQQAVSSQQEDGMQRHLSLARLKGRSLTLSEQLRGEMNGEYQRREKLQAEAAATNDPEKMAQASNEKDAYDAQFSAQLKDREDQLKKEIADAMKPRPEIGQRLEAATAEWRQVADASTAFGNAEKNLARLGLAAALLAQGNPAEAETTLQASIQEPAASPFLHAETHLLLSVSAAQKLPSLAGEAAKPAAESGLALANKALEILSALPASQRNLSLTSRAQLLAADFQSALGNTDIAQTLRSTATKAEEEAAKDNSWLEILRQSRLSLDEARRQLLATGSPPASDQFQLTQAADLALRAWHGNFLSAAPPNAIAEAVATAQLVVSTDIDRFPWQALLDGPGLLP